MALSTIAENGTCHSGLAQAEYFVDILDAVVLRAESALNAADT